MQTTSFLPAPFLLIVLLLALSATTTSGTSTTTVSQATIGAAECFNQKISAFLDLLVQLCDFVCQVNLVSGSALPGAYNPFGSQYGYPLVSSLDSSFYEIYYGRPDEGFCAVSRNTSGGPGFVGYEQAPNATYRLAYPLDQFGQLDTTASVVNQTYTSTARIWYTGAVASPTGVYVTVTPYVFASTFTLGISASQACYRGNTLEIVSSTAALLNVLTVTTLNTDTCSQFDTANGAVAYVVNNAGQLVLESDVILSDILLANSSSSGLVRAAAAALSSMGAGVAAVEQGQFSYSGSNWEFYSLPISASIWNWAVVVIQPVTTSSASTLASPFWAFFLHSLSDLL
jgi:hypothetical protein